MKLIIFKYSSNNSYSGASVQTGDMINATMTEIPESRNYKDFHLQDFDAWLSGRGWGWDLRVQTRRFAMLPKFSERKHEAIL